MVRTRLRNKEEYVVLPKELVYFASELIRVYKSLKMFEYDFQSNILIFSYANRITKMKFYKNGHFNGEFSSFLGEYDFLEPIKGNTVIDVGANIADSSISFALSGASKVIAVEPYRWSYGMATENIELNNLKDCIVMLNAGSGGSTHATGVTGIRNPHLSSAIYESVVSLVANRSPEFKEIFAREISKRKKPTQAYILVGKRLPYHAYSIMKNHKPYREKLPLMEGTVSTQASL